MSDDQKPGPSTLTCALVGLGGAAAVVGVLHLIAGKKSEKIGVLRDPSPDGEPLLGCKAYELEPGDEFSIDEGRSWLTVETIVEDGDEHYINARDDDNKHVPVRLDSYQHVLLNRHWKG